jgi:hypothetical protein
MIDINITINNTVPFETPTSTPLSTSVPLTIGLWNANGLQASVIHDVLRHCQSFSLLFITETWLLLPHGNSFTSMVPQLLATIVVPWE